MITDAQVEAAVKAYHHQKAPYAVPNSHYDREAMRAALEAAAQAAPTPTAVTDAQVEAACAAVGWILCRAVMRNALEAAAQAAAPRAVRKIGGVWVEHVKEAAPARGTKTAAKP